MGPEARLEEPCPDATGPRRDVPPAGHGAGRRPRVPAFTTFAHVLDGGHPGGRQGLLREARARMEGTLNWLPPMRPGLHKNTKARPPRPLTRSKPARRPA